MTNKIFLPNKASQISGAYRSFTHLDYIKNRAKGSYAISSNPIDPKSGDKNQPATVTVSDFKCNLPSNAVVKKVTVHYKHAKRGLCNNQICKNAKDVCNIPKPTISIWQAESGGASKLAGKKGTAPVKDDGIHQTVSFDGIWNASIFNNKKFQVEMYYPENTNNHKGYILLSYIYIELDYFVPQFSLSTNSANTDKVYNNGEYHVRVNLSDANLTGKTSKITINIPTGFTYRGYTGNGTVKKTQATTLEWTPKMRAEGYRKGIKQTPSSASVELIFDVAVTFSSGESTYPFSIPCYRAGSLTPVTHNGVIYKEIPSQRTDDDGKQHYDDDAGSSTQPDIALVTVEEEFDYTLSVPDDQMTELLHTIYEYGISEEWWTGTYEEEYNTIIANSQLYFTGKQVGTHFSKNDRLNWKDWNGWKRTGMSYSLSSFIGDGNSCSIQIKGVLVGYDEVYLELQAKQPETYNYHTFTDLESTWKFLIRPQESSLTVPNFVKFPPTEEEVNRLGDGYNYTVQSDLELVTSEEYVRDWYKNFRIGVFNNKIASNCSTYYLQESTEDSLNGEIKLTSLYDITNGYLKVTSDNQITLTIQETEYTIGTSPTTIPLNEEYILAVLYDKVASDSCILTIQQYTSNNTKVDELEYHINFNAEQDTILTEMETDTTDYTTLTDEEIFENAEWWTQQTAGLNTPNNINVEFTYNKNYPLYVLITGDYPQGAPTTNTIEFTEPCIIETDTYSQRLPNGKYPIPIENTITTEDASEITLEAYDLSDSIILYELPLEEHYGTNTEQAVRGIELTGNIEQSDRVVVYAKLKSPTGESRQRSIVLDEYATNIDSDHIFHIGGNGDLWGFTTLEITDLDQWEVELSISNNLEETTSNLNFNNLQLILYIEQVEEQNITCYIEGEDIRYYGVFLTQVKIPEGLETDTSYLKVDGTDTNDAYRQNIKEKEITLEFDLGNDCDLEGNTLSRRDFARLLVNDRDEYNRPIPKRIEFSHYPDVFWEYVMEEALEDKIDIGSYIDGKVKLTIPDGTAYDKEPTTTSNMGYVNGLATINPVIIVKPTEDVVTIRETITGQEFHIGYSNWNNRILEVDCNNKNAWLLENEDDEEPILLNKYIDYNSDWFRLKGEFNFEGVNCIVRTVETRERW